MNKNLAKAINNLEKRVIALENAMGIMPDEAHLTHPKALRQAKWRKAQAEQAKEVKK